MKAINSLFFSLVISMTTMLSASEQTLISHRPAWQKWLQNPPSVPVAVVLTNVTAGSNTPVVVTLADGLAVGYGDTNGCSTTTNGPVLFANVHVRREYLLTVVATNLQQLDLALAVKTPWQMLSRSGSDSVPKNYSILVNRDFADTITAQTNCTYYSNSWIIEIRDHAGARWALDDQSNDPSPAPGDGDFLEIGPAKSLLTNIISLEWSVALGRLYDGLAAGRLRWSESGLTRDSFTPKALYLSAASTNVRSQVELITSLSDASLHQVKAFQTFVDILDPWTFITNDILDVPSLANRLKTETTGVSPYVSNHLSATTIQALTNYSGGGSNPEPLRTLLVQDFNVLIAGSCIYDTTRFSGVTLSSETQFLLPQNVLKSDLLRLNRLLLQDAYATQLAKRPLQTMLSFYQPSQVGSGTNRDGIYTNITGSPFVIWQIQNPAPTNLNNLLVIESRNGINRTNSLVFDPVAGTENWVLTTGTGSEQKTESRGVAFVFGTATNRFETNCVRYFGGSNVYKCIENYQLFPWGWELVETRADPDGVNLVTSIEFYTDPNDGFTFSMPHILRYPDGLWEVRLYYENDWCPPRTLEYVLRPFNGLPANPADAAPDNCDVHFYSWWWKDLQSARQHVQHYVADLSGGSPDETIGTYNDGTFIQHWDTHTQQHYGGHEIGYTAYRGGSLLGKGLEDHEFEVIDSKGPQRSMYYKGGTFNPSTGIFSSNGTTVADGPDWCQYTVIWGNPDASALYPNRIHVTSIEAETLWDNGNPGIDLIPFASTRQADIYKAGSLVAQQISVFTNVDNLGEPGFEALQNYRYVNDSLGHTTNITLIDVCNPLVLRTIYEANFKDGNGNDGELLRWEIDDTGIRKEYIYDSLKRVTQIARIGITNGTTSIPTITTNRNYDAYGRVLSQVTTAGTLSVTNRSAFDLAGRLITSTPENGLTTSNYYSSGGRIITSTLPSGATSIRENYTERQLKSITGTGVIPEFHFYSAYRGRNLDIDENVYLRDTVHYGATDSPRWKLTGWMYLEDLPILTMFPDYDPSVTNYEVKMYGYWLHHPITVQQAGKALTSYNMDFDGRPMVTVQSPEPGHDIDNLSRVTATLQFYSKDPSSGHWFLAQTNLIYLTDNSSNATVTGVQLLRLSGFSSGSSQSEITTMDADTNTTVVTTYLDRANKTVTKVTNTPQSTLDATNITIDGLLISESTPTVTTPTRFVYEGLGRQASVASPLGFTATTCYNQYGQVSGSTDFAGNVTSYQYYGNGVQGAGQLYCEIRNNGRKTYHSYTVRGEPWRTWGDVPYPEERVYSAYGELIELHTFRNGSGWNSSIWPSLTTGTYDATTWTYQEHSGLLTNRSDASNHSVSYTYTNGMLYTRTWARGVSCTNSYDEFGDIIQIDYSDGTPSVVLTNLDRAGMPRTIIDAGGASVLTYDHAERLKTSACTNGLLAGITVSNHFNGLNGRDSLSVLGLVTAIKHDYSYDAYGRLGNVSAGNCSATYAYLPNSDLLQTTTCKTNSTTILTTTRSWEYGMRLSAILNQVDGTIVSSHGYQYDSLNRRTRAALEDGSIWMYDYNDRDEVIGARRYWADWSPVSGQQFAYAFDSVGNRTTSSAGGDANGWNLRTTIYTANSLNEYTTISTPGYKDIVGLAFATKSVTVNSGTADRKSEYFHREISISNSGGPLWQNATADSDGVTNVGGCVFPGSSQSLTYDADGNLTFDGTWTYQWDGENRLKTMVMTNVSGIANSNRLKLEFAYDLQNRRLQKVISTWNGSAFASPTTNRFVYDGWNLIAEIQSSSLTRSYAWGEDLSGTMTKAGGVGGLAITTSYGSSATNCFPSYDGNGNITALLSAADKSTAARYEYSPFGELLRATGLLARQNPFQFSTKFTDIETSLVYYGMRYYSPLLGRWIGREPTVDQVFLHLFAFCANNPVSRFDLDGRSWSDLWNFVEGVGVVLTGTATGAATGFLVSGGNPAGALVGAIAGTANGLFALISGSINGDSWGQMYGKAAITGALSGLVGGMSTFGVLAGGIGGGIAGLANQYIYGSRHGSALIRAAVLGTLLGMAAGYAGEADDAWLDGALAFAAESGGSTANGYWDWATE